MGGDSGQSAQNVVQETPESLKRIQKLDSRKSNSAISDLLSSYGSGKTSLSEALGGIESRAASNRARASELQSKYDAIEAKRAARADEYDRLKRGDKGGGGGPVRNDILTQQQQMSLAQAKKQGANWLDEYNREMGGYKSEQDALRAEIAAAQEGSDAGMDREALLSSLVQDPLAGAKLASEQVRGDAVLGRLFGDSGLMSRVDAEEQRLGSQGYQLQQEDREAYGQAAGDIQRQYQQQEGELAKSLAARGLSAAPSGAAGAGFSGLMGNKYEQLAKAQTAIADKRMQNTMQRLQANRAMMSNLGGQYDTSVGNQTNRNLAAIGDRRNERMGSTQLSQAQQQAQQAQLNTAFDQQQATAAPGFGEVLGGVAGAGLGALAGGAGAGIGAGIGSKVGGLFGKK